jgi:hypothetical protein
MIGIISAAAIRAQGSAPNQEEVTMRYILTAASIAAAPLAAASAQHEQNGGGHEMPADLAGTATAAMPTQSGQAAFGAITEVVGILQADPRTDWSKVDIDALRNHLVDMDNVSLRARVTNIPVAGGMRFDIAGEGAVRDSIRRMAASHASMANGQDGQHVTVAESPDGATMIVTSDDPAGSSRIRALGFFGAMTGGVHHQLHHLMMARGEMHH